VNYYIASIGGALSGIGLASGNQLSILCGTIWICTSLIVTAIKVYRP